MLALRVGSGLEIGTGVFSASLEPRLATAVGSVGCGGCDGRDGCGGCGSCGGSDGSSYPMVCVRRRPKSWPLELLDIMSLIAASTRK